MSDIAVLFVMIAVVLCIIGFLLGIAAMVGAIVDYSRRKNKD